MSKRRHHYNPQYYLRGFTESDASRYLWRYDKGSNGKSERMNVRNAGVERDYYLYTREDGVKDRETVENILNNIVEQPANPIIKKIRSGSFDISKEEKATLANYLTATITRVPRNRQRIERIMPDFISQYLSDFQSRLPEYRKLYDLSYDQEQRLLEYINRWPDEPPNILFLPLLSPNISAAISSMHWYYIRPAKEKYFLSCDNPAAFTEANGLKPPAGELLFPVSKNVALWATWENVDWPTPFVADRELTQAINKKIMGFAVQYVYSCCRDDWIQELIEDILSTAHVQTMDE